MPSDPAPRSDPDRRPADAVGAETASGAPSGWGQTPGGPFETRVGPQPPPGFGGYFPTVPGFRVVRELGRGGMGVVYEAHQEGLERTVALKILRLATTSAVARFRAEAQAIARLNHPDIVQVYDYGEHNGEPYLALEYCPGGTLAGRLEGGLPPAEEAVAVVARLARAVHAAHRAGVIHRDLKPHNVLVAADGSPKVTDFGLAKLVGGDTGMTATGDVLGTPCYMAPEQADADPARIGPATDVYALGAILFELLTGRPPFKGANAIQTLDHVRTLDPPRPRDLNPKVPADLESVVLQCLEKDPAGRYVSAAELADDLRRWLDSEPVRARRQTLTYRLAKRARRYRRAVAAGVVVVVGLLAGWLAAADAGRDVPGGAAVRDWLDARGASALRPVPTDRAIRERAKAHRERLARELAGRRFRGGWVRSVEGRQGGDPWTQMQTLTAFGSAPEAGAEDVALTAAAAAEAFGKNPVVRAFEDGVGWPREGEEYASAEPAGWALAAWATAARRGAEGRGPLERVQGALAACQALDPGTGRFEGGWTLFAGEEPPGVPNPYITALAFQGLLEMRDAGLGWRGSGPARDELLGETARHLLGRFDGTGWRTQGEKPDEYNDGLTLLILAQLLRAEAAGLVELPGPVLARVAALVDECGRRPPDHPMSVALFDNLRVRVGGGRVLDAPTRTVRFPWYPWAVRTAALWLARLERTHGSRLEVVRTRRALGNLVLTIGDRVVGVAVGSGTSYLMAEALIGLSAVPPP